MKCPEVVILGGGICGLYVGRGLEKRGIPFALYEAEDTPGGLSRTFRTGRFSWDLGVHALYSKNKDFASFLRSLPIAYKSCDRDVRICHPAGDAIHELDYPFENGLRQLPDDDWEDCIAGYMEARLLGRTGFAHLEDWILNGLGSGIARCFMIPYNKKIWNCPLDRISLRLVSNKIEPEPFEKILRSALGQTFVGRAYQARFLYPEGGIQEFIGCFHAPIRDKVRLGRRVSRITPGRDGHEIHFDGGDAVRCKTIISTIPLTALIDCLPYPELKARRPELTCNNTLFILIGLKQGRRFKRFDSCHWAFFAHEDVFYRITMMHNFSDGFPHALVAEYTVKDGESPAPGGITERVVEDLLGRGILPAREDIETTATHFQPNTYPIPTLGLKRTKDYVTDFLAREGIRLVGRNGAWDYLNIDGVVASADAFLEGFTPSPA